jgi:hypothetical protein
MIKVRKVAPPGDNSVAMDAHARETLRYIRSSMDAATLIVTPGSAGIVIGTVGVAAALLCAAEKWAFDWRLVWISAAPVAGLLGAGVMARQQRIQGRTVFGASTRRFAFCMAPPLLTGTVLTAVLFHLGQLRILPGIWLLLYGCAVLAASASTVRVIAWLGALFMVLGTAALVLPETAQNLILGVGFGGLHLAFGGYLARRVSS